MKCTHCNDRLKSSNTSCASLGENMCQECHTRLLEENNKKKQFTDCK